MTTKKIVTVFITFFIIILITIGIIANMGPKITLLEVDHPVSIYNDEIGKYGYDNYTINKTTKQLTISGLTERNANVTSYVIYNLNSSSYFEPTDGFLDNKRTKITKIKVDPSTGQFQFNIKLNPNDQGPSYVYIEAKSPGKEDNAVELIIIYPLISEILQNKASETKNTSDSSYIQKLTQDEMGYEHGYLDGYYATSLETYSGEFGDGYDRGYQTGWYDAQNNNKPEWKIYGTYYRWSPSDVAYYDTRTNQIV